MRNRRVVGAVVVSVVWAGLLLWFLAWAAAVHRLGDTYCPNPDQVANWGELTWSLMPPGPRCSWTEDANGLSDTSGPSLLMSTWLLLLLVVGVGAVRAIRGVRRSR